MQDLVAGDIEIDEADGRAAGARREQRRLVHEVREVCAGEPGGAAGDGSQVHVRLHRDLRDVHLEDRFAAPQVGVADGHLPIESSGPEQRLVEDVRAVRGRDDDDALVGGKAVHLDEQLVEGLLALFVAERLSAAASADGVELVDEDDARAVLPGVLEHPPDAGGADAGVHLDEVRAAGVDERHAGFTGNRARQQRLAGPRRPDEQHALRDAAADGRVARRLAQEVDDLADLGLRLVHAGHVRERDHVARRIGHPALAFHRRQASAAEAINRKGHHRQQADRQDDGADVDRGSGGRADGHLDAALDEVGHERRVRGDVAERRGGLNALAALQRRGQRFAVDVERPDVVGARQAKDVAEGDLARRGALGAEAEEEDQRKDSQPARQDECGTAARRRNRQTGTPATDRIAICSAYRHSVSVGPVRERQATDRPGRRTGRSNHSSLAGIPSRRVDAAQERSPANRGVATDQASRRRAWA